MASSSRRKLLGRARKSVFHCSTRCVRRAFLWGNATRWTIPPTGAADAVYSGKSKVRGLMQFLAARVPHAFQPSLLSTDPDWCESRRVPLTF